MNANRISKVLREKRKQKKLTMQQLADFLKVSKSSIFYWEKGTSVPPGDILIKLAKELGFLDELIADDKTDEELREEEVSELKSQIRELNTKIANLSGEEVIEEQEQDEITNLRKELSDMRKQMKQMADHIHFNIQKNTNIYVKDKK